MADVSIKYKGSTIAEMDGAGSKTMKTAGTYCEGDIVVDYAPSSNNSTGFLSLSTIDVTIGANTVGNATEALNFLSNLADGKLCAAALLDNPTEHRQLTCLPGVMATPEGYNPLYRVGYRIDNGTTIRWISILTDYIAFLVEGSRYRIWIADINETNVSPY